MRPKTTAARQGARGFWVKVDQSGECWIWLGRRDEDGYGTYHRHKAAGGMQRAHRVSWEIHFGPIPEGLNVLHQCDNPPCVNPGHLFLGTDADNMADKCSKGRHVSGMAVHPERAAKGEEVGSARLTRDQVLAIRGRHASGQASQGALAREYGVAVPTVKDIIHRRTWRWLDGG